MTTNFSPKQPYEAYAICFDFAPIIGVETVVGISVTAIDISTLEDVSLSVLDVNKQMNNNTAVYPWIRAGESGHSYLITCRIVTNLSSMYELEGVLPVQELPGDGYVGLTRHRLTTGVVNLAIPQGVTYFQRWQIRYKTTLLPFPFFNENGIPLWKGRCMFRTAYGSATPILTLTTENGGVTLELEDGKTYYGLVVTAAQASLIPPTNLPSSPSEKPVYDIEFERFADGWVIRPQKGKITAEAEATL